MPRSLDSKLITMWTNLWQYGTLERRVKLSLIFRQDSRTYFALLTAGNYYA